MEKINGKKEKGHAHTSMNFGVREQSERGHAPTPMNFGVRERSERGFVILIAVIIAGIFTVIGASILLISIKELELSAGGTQSQYAFYASDTGMECALYWDLRYNAFATSTESVETGPMYCAGYDITTPGDWVWRAGDLTGYGDTGDEVGNTSFYLRNIHSGREDCALVYVTKVKDVNTFRTYIESRGYNTCDATNPRRVERALRARY